MNKHEAIKKVEQMGEYERFVNESIPKLSVLNILNQLNEPQKPIVPQFVADHLKKSKEVGRDLQDAMNSSTILEKVDLWLYTDNNMDVFARAWLDGYTVEKEKRHTVKFKNIQRGTEYLKYDRVVKRWYFGLEESSIERTMYHTRKELEEAGFGWVFDCEGIEIEEVE